ncbi:MAG: T9SS type A sorting domain-containing protein [Candidatus Krumholzibacteriaceae bacterium]|jgi:hypothetical protein
MGKCFRSALVAALVVCTFGGSSARAHWAEGGVAVCTAINNQSEQQIVPDGSGGAIIVWTDFRNGNNDIYAQRVSASGSPMWVTDGVLVCLAPGTQQGPQLICNGAGGALIVWEDYRSGLGTSDIYAQRLDADGSALWAVDGVAICVAAGSQRYPQLASNGAGGAVIAWDDYRVGAEGLYLQRVEADGSCIWNLDGFRIHPGGGGITGRQIIPDGSGGVFVTWVAADVLRAQRIALNSAAQWTADGAIVCSASGGKQYPAIVPDGSGGVVIAWEDGRNGEGDIFAQRLDRSGEAQWTANGVPVCTAAGAQERLKLTSDGSGGAIATWQDFRSGGAQTNLDVYVQRVDAHGSALWAADGVDLSEPGIMDWYPDITSDGAGGAIVTWAAVGGSGKSYVQRVDAGGLVRWTPGGVALFEGSDQIFPVIAPEGSGGAIVAWMDSRGSGINIYAQKFDGDGLIPTGTLLEDYSVAVTQGAPSITWRLSSIDTGAEPSVERSADADGPFVEMPSGMTTCQGLSFVFVDTECESGASYWYRVGMRTGEDGVMLFETGPVTVPAVSLTLMQNHPNPFNPSTMISYYMPASSVVTLDVYDSSGRLIAKLLDRAMEPKGTHSIEWQGVDSSGRTVSSGVYFYRLTSGKETISKKMVLLR